MTRGRIRRACAHRGGKGKGPRARGGGRRQQQHGAFAGARAPCGIPGGQRRPARDAVLQQDLPGRDWCDISPLWPISHQICRSLCITFPPARDATSSRKHIGNFRNIPNIIGTKEANGDISSVAKTLALCGDDLHRLLRQRRPGAAHHGAGRERRCLRFLQHSAAAKCPRDLHPLCLTGKTGRRPAVIS